MEGYHGLMPLFLLHLVLVIAVVGISIALNNEASGFFLLGGFLAVMVGIGFLSLKLTRKIGFGAGWPPSGPILASVGLAICTVACGIWGYVILQNVALGHIRKFGVKSGFFGMKKRDMKARIEELRALEGGAVAA